MSLDDRKIPSTVHAAIITAASQSEAAPVTSVQYAATTVGDASVEISVPMSYPIGGRVFRDDSLANVIPSVPGDPCFIMEFIGSAPGIVVLREFIDTGACP